MKDIAHELARYDAVRICCFYNLVYPNPCRGFGVGCEATKPERIALKGRLQPRAAVEVPLKFSAGHPNDYKQRLRT